MVKFYYDGICKEKKYSDKRPLSFNLSDSSSAS